MNRVFYPIVLSILFLAPVSRAVSPQTATSGLALLSSVPSLMMTFVHAAEFSNIHSSLRHAKPENVQGLIEAGQLEIASTVLSTLSAGAGLSVCLVSTSANTEMKGLGKKLAIAAGVSATLPLAVTIMSGMVSNRLSKAGEGFAATIAALETGWAGFCTLLLGAAVISAAKIKRTGGTFPST